MGVIGNMPAPTPTTPSFSAADRPMKAASPAPTTTSQSAPCSSASFSHAGAFWLTMRARAVAVVLRVVPAEASVSRTEPGSP